VSGYGFRRRPIFAAGFRGRAICMARSRSGSVKKNGWPLFHFGCVLTRRTARWALPRTTSLHRS